MSGKNVGIGLLLLAGAVGAAYFVSQSAIASPVSTVDNSGAGFVDLSGAGFVDLSGPFQYTSNGISGGITNDGTLSSGPTESILSSLFVGQLTNSGESVLIDTGQVDAQALAKAEQILKLREGYTLTVKPDNLNIPSVGIGHKVLASDNLKLYDTITSARAQAFFQADVSKALAAAKSQAADLGHYTVDFIAALISVNFQLGTVWNVKFANTYNSLKNGNWQDAVNRLQSSTWASQTPERVQDFAQAIENTYANA